MDDREYKTRFVMKAICFWSVTCILVLVGGCASGPGLNRVDLDEWIRIENRSALLGNEPSEFTLRHLRRQDFLTSFRNEPEQLLLKMDQGLCPQADRDALFALSELSYLQAKRAKGNRAQELKLYLSSARYAYACLFDEGSGTLLNEFDPRFRLACDFYNRSLAALFEDPLAGTKLVEQGRTTIPLIRGELHIQAPRDAAIQLERLDRDSLAYTYDVTGFTTQNRMFGIGVPVIAERTAGGSKREGDVDLRRRLPQVTPATVLLRFNTQICEEGRAGRNPQATFEVLNPLETRKIEIAGRQVPLEADLTTPLAFLLEANRDLEGVSGMKKKLKGDAISDRRGLYMMQPYQPGKIPVVFVHGLMSDPTVWHQILNDLMFDPVLSQRYQFWAFFYTTSNPILFSAAELRESLLWTRGELDPDGRDPALDQMVIVGHSMGGLLTRLMIQRNEHSYLAPYLGTRIDDLDISEREKETLKKVDTFEPLSFVDRVVFMATPHRGSKMAQGFIGRVGDSISSTPTYILDAVKGTLEAVGMSAKDISSGIDDLQTDSRFMGFYNGLPMAPDVPYHSIIGNKTKADTPGGSDGVVAYESSHLEGAASEKIVKSGHTVMDQTQAILEVRRILSLHLKASR